METTLPEFVNGWKEKYVRQQRAIPLFQPELTARFTLAQQQAFFVGFHELRLYFVELLGFLASRAPTAPYRRVYVQNWLEETGTDKPQSHEQLWQQAASACGVNIAAEERWGRTHRSYTYEFNHEFRQWILEQIVRHGPEKAWHYVHAAFCAYELLDNVDYPKFLGVAKSFRIVGEALKFFKVHIVVEHYKQGKKLLKKIWRIDPEAVKIGFGFIVELQTKAFQALSDELFTFEN